MTGARTAPHVEAGTAGLCISALPQPAHRVVVHLLRCARCRRSVLRLLEEHDDPAALAALGAALEYSAAFARLEAAAEATRRAYQMDRRRAGELVAELLHERPERWTERLGREAPTAALVHVLLEQCYDRAEEWPALAESLAREALAQLDRLEGALHPGELAGLDARAWALLGFVRGEQQRFEAAEQAFAAAAKALGSEHLGSLEEVAYLTLVARVRRRQGRPGEAVALLDRAGELLALHDEHAEAGERLEQAADVLFEAGDVEGEIARLAEALLALLAAQEDAPAQQREARVRRRLVWALLVLGEHAQAREVLKESRFEGEPPEARLEGLLVLSALEAGGGPALEAELRQALATFKREGWATGAVLVWLVLASALIRGGRTAELARLAAELDDLRPPAGAVGRRLGKLRAAAADGTATVAMALDLASLLATEGEKVH